MLQGLVVRVTQQGMLCLFGLVWLVLFCWTRNRVSGSRGAALNQGGAEAMVPPSLAHGKDGNHFLVFLAVGDLKVAVCSLTITVATEACMTLGVVGWGRG